MVDAPTLRFRRHLAVCVLVLLACELEPLSRLKYTRVRLAAAQIPNAIQQDNNNNQPMVNSNGAGQVYEHIETKPWHWFISDTMYQIGSYMPVLDFNYTLLSEHQFEYAQLDEEVDDYYNELYPPNATHDQLQLLAIKAALRMAPMPIHTSWGYETRAKMRLGSLPVQNDAKCAQQLAHLARRLDTALVGSAGPTGSGPPTKPAAAASQGQHRAAAESTPVENFEAQQIYNSKDLNFWRYLETFGRVPADLLRGNVRWYGSYASCLDMRLGASREPVKWDNKRAIKFRYCLGALKSIDWQQEQLLTGTVNNKNWSQHLGVHERDFGNYFIRIGMCLPEACDSSAIEQQPKELERLVKFNLAKPFNSDHYYLSDLYCVPDNRSPLRSIPLLGKLLILLAFGWMCLVGGATLVHLNVESFYTKAVEEIRQKRQLAANNSSFFSTTATTNENDTNSSRSHSLDSNNLHESDVLHLKHYWIQLNMFIWDKSRELIAGVDLIGCLSLYSNWLKYTQRAKVAIAEQHARELQLAACRLRNEQLVAKALAHGERHSAETPSSMGQDHASSNEAHASRINNNNNNNKGRAPSQAAAAGSSVMFATLANDSETTTTTTTSRNSNEKLVQAQKTTTTTQTNHHNQIDGPNHDNNNNTNLLLKGQTQNGWYKSVDTSSLNALKVIALIWIIAGHCIFFLGSSLANGAELKNHLHTFIIYALSNGALYITELFFIVTGCLTAYLTFKQNSFRSDDTGSSDNLQLGDMQHQPPASRTLVAAGKAGNQRIIINDDDDDDNIDSRPSGRVCLQPRLFRAPFWLLPIVNRYLRIVPTYLVVYSFIKLVSVYVGGEGQTWDYAVSGNSMRLSCATESWLPVLTLTTNLVDIYKHCIVGGWYLSVDMQFAIVAVPLLFVMALCQRQNGSVAMLFNGSSKKLASPTSSSSTESSKRKQQQQQQQLSLEVGQHNSSQQLNAGNLIVAKASGTLLLGYGLIFTLGFATMILSLLFVLWQTTVDLSYVPKLAPHAIAILSRVIAMYTNSIFRFRAFACGLLLGHCLYLYEFQLIKLPKLIQLHGSKLMVILFSVGFVIMFMPVVYPKGKLLLSHDMTAILSVLTAAGIDIFLSAIIFLICIGKAPKLLLFILNSPFWQLLSSLSLCAFLIHCEVIILLTSQLDPPPNVHICLLVFVFSATVLITYWLAFILYLSFELPMTRLIESLMKKYLFKTGLMQKAVSNSPPPEVAEKYRLLNGSRRREK